MASILITGTSRGLGLELVHQLSSPPISATIFATARSSQPSTALSKVIDTAKGRVHFVSLDVDSDSSVTTAVQQVESLLGPNTGLDILINNAGIQKHEGSPSQIKVEDFSRILSTNVISVQRVTSAFIPLLTQGQDKKIVNITSSLGSIGSAKNFDMVPTPSYKVSKAALNMLTVQYALELGGSKGFTVFAISPGNLKTELGGWNAPLEVADGARSVVQKIMEATSEKDNGTFKDIFIEGSDENTGQDLPW